MLINRLIKMYGLRHKHIRIEDQQLNLKMNIIKKILFKKDNISVIPTNILRSEPCTQKIPFKTIALDHFNYLAK